MIREKRNKEKLASYYRKFMEDGVIDPNVHPWVCLLYTSDAADEL